MSALKKNISLSDGTALAVGLAGNPANPVVMLPVFKQSVYGKDADNLRMWGVDPELGKHMVEGLSDRFRIIYFDYEGHLMGNPRPELLTPDSICQDFLQIADEMNVPVFSYYGYSWLALAGLQLAIRSDRLESLIMGGFPPLDGPYKEMLTVTTRTHEQALRQENNAHTTVQTSEGPEGFDWSSVQIALDPKQTKQFYTLYDHLREFDDKSIHEQLKLPRLAFAGERDTIVYGENFGGVTVDIAGVLRTHEAALTEQGWDIALLQGEDMDHTKAMQPDTVLPLIKPWLTKHLLDQGK
jgi:pimeloyl-ACP methyl ester carboxylesterase